MDMAIQLFSIIRLPHEIRVCCQLPKAKPDKSRVKLNDAALDESLQTVLYVNFLLLVSGVICSLFEISLIIGNGCVAKCLHWLADIPAT